MTSQELLKKRNDLFGEMKAIMDLPSDKRSEGDYAKLDALNSDYEKLDKQITAEVRYSDIEKKLNEVTEKRAIGSSTFNNDENFRSAFIQYVRSGDINEVRDLSGFSTSEGGAVLPTLLAQQVIGLLAKEVTVRRLPGVRVLNTTSTLDIPLIGADVVATWGAEAPSGSYTETDPTLSKTTLRAYKLTALLKASEELLNDTPTNIEAELANSITRGFLAQEESAFLTGDGSGKPLGIFNTSGIGGLTVTGSVSGSQVTDALINLEYEIEPQWRDQATYIFSDALAKLARTAKDGFGRYMWQSSLIAGQPNQFNGRPVLISGMLPKTLSTGIHGGIVNGNFITIGDRTAFNLLRLNELYAASGQIGFRAMKRTDCVATQIGALASLTIN